MQNSTTKMALAGLVAVAALGCMGAYELAGASQTLQPTTVLSANPSTPGAQKPGNAQVAGSNHTVNNTHSTGSSGSASSSSGSSTGSGGWGSGSAICPAARVGCYGPVIVHAEAHRWQTSCHLPAKRGDHAVVNLEWWTAAVDSVDVQFNGQTIASVPTTFLPGVSLGGDFYPDGTNQAGYGSFTTAPNAAYCGTLTFTLVGHGDGKTVSKVITVPAAPTTVDGPVQTPASPTTTCLLHPYAPGCPIKPVPVH
jgi:hypothetical protein